MSELQKLVKATLKRYGDLAPVHFGIKKTTLDGYLKRGKYPLALIEKILSDPRSDNVEEKPPQPEPEPPPPPQPTIAEFASKPPLLPTEYEVRMTNRRVEDIVNYIQGTVDVYLKQFAHRIDMLEKQMAAVRAGQMRAAIGISSLARPDQNAPVEQTFTTNPLGNSLDTGVAPTKDMVDAQANMTIIEGVPVRGAQLARPAEPLPNQPSYGFGWNLPRPRK